MLVDSTSAICLGGFYRSVSKCCRVFDEKIGEYYYSLSCYYLSKGTSEFLTYNLFGSSVVGFSINYSQRIHRSFPASVNQIDTLKKIYGEKSIDSWAGIGTAEIPLDKTKLIKSMMEIDGYCVGSSLCFISQYLQKVKSDISPMEAIKAVSLYYANGAPDEAQLAQIFYQSLDMTQLTSKVLSQFTVSCYEKLMNNFPVPREFKELEQLAKKLKPVVGLERIGLVARKYNLIRGNQQVHVFYNHIDVERKIMDLEEGVHLVNFFAKNTIPHAMVIIKAKEKCFIYDPNFGILSVNPRNLKEELGKLNLYWDYIKKEGGVISFTEYQLAH